jgi:predicted GTPase
MQPKHALTARLANLQSWRYGITTQIVRVADFLRAHGYSSAETEATFDQLTATANAARVNIIFIAEASRGKSELINALFFSDLGRRLLPSGIRQATRCITEVRFDRERKTSLRLLPIESREAPRRFADIYADDAEWQTIPFDADVPTSIDSAFATLAETRRATVAETVAWGLHTGSKTGAGVADGYVEVPRWRYAVINFPHPILDAGLVVIDTPGLSALTAEPEFSRENIPEADAVVVVLDASEGVTKPDLAIWKEKLGGSRNFRERERDESGQARIVVMNKIDRLFEADPIDEKEADRKWLKEVDRRVQDVADLMRIEPIKVVPVSALMALHGAFENDQDAQLKSRLYRLERALADHLPAHREALLGKDILNTLSSTLESIQGTLDQGRFEALEGLRALGDIRTKNQAMSEALARETGDKRTQLAAALQELRAIKPIHTKLANELAALSSPAIAKLDATDTAKRISGTLMTGKIPDTLSEYFAATRKHVAAIDAKLDEIRTLFGNLGEKHFRIIGLGHHEVHPFATNRFQIEIDKAEEEAYAELTRTGNMLVRRASAIAEQFEIAIAPRVIHVFEIAHRESTSWMRGVFLGIERPLEELNKRLTARAAKVEVVRSAELDLAEKIAEFQARLDVIKSKHAELGVLREGLERFAGRRRKAD